MTKPADEEKPHRIELASTLCSYHTLLKQHVNKNVHIHIAIYVATNYMREHQLNCTFSISRIIDLKYLIHCESLVLRRL